MISRKWVIHLPSTDKPDSCLLFLPGRAQEAVGFTSRYARLGLDSTIIIGVTTHERKWYPMPNGPADQKDALKGIPEAIKAVEEVIYTIMDQYQLPRDKIILAGFSAGGVMALQVGMNNTDPLAGVLCHSGAILEPKTTKPAQNNMPILLTHTYDDSNFEWHERYIPMKTVLDDNSYNLYCYEEPDGEHNLTTDALYISAKFIAMTLLGNKKYKVPSLDLRSVMQ